MRAFVSALLLFFILICGIVINAIYISSTCDKLSSLSERLKTSDEREALISEIKDLWDKNDFLLNISIRANEIERMNDLIESLLSSHISQNEAEFQKYCSLISELAEEFSHYEKISLRSIC